MRRFDSTLPKRKSRSFASHAGIRPRANPFGYDVGIEQKAHRSILRGLSLARPTFKQDLRNGEAAKNSAKFPTRLVFRSHSRASTTTTAVRPFFVIVCGPPDWARSMTSLNFAFASATVYVAAVMVKILR